ncbi:MAG TPA: kynureninase [Bacteroidia bacterium]|jgi:kynureninase|nr:kynureninase [Bacteroidia bacterium]HRG51329.1 kynureninase [Bacteroidia bacterium]
MQTTTSLDTITYKSDQAFAKEMDEKDPLRKYRDQFHFPKNEKGKYLLYFCGNSLGLQPKTVRTYIEQELKDWERLGVEGHFQAKNPWMPYHEFLTEQMSRVVGGKPIEVVVMNTLTLNLHLMMVSFYRPTKTKYKIVIEGGAFPSDQYAVKSQLNFHGIDVQKGLIELVPRKGEDTLRTEDIEALIEKEGDSIALIMLGGVNYYTGQLYDMKRITAAGHKAGSIVGFDLAHAAGNVNLQLHDWDVDFAVWCGYKYLNSGPGGIAGCFVHERHATNKELPRFAGWWGHDKKTRFLMGPEFVPISGAEGWQLSNSPVLAMASLRASLAIFDEAGMQQLTTKSRLLTGYLEYLIQETKNTNINIITPKDPTQRGAQLSIRIKNSDKSFFNRLVESGVICDWREPDVIRLAPAPLYNSFQDVFQFVELLKKQLS